MLVNQSSAHTVGVIEETLQPPPDDDDDKHDDDDDDDGGSTMALAATVAAAVPASLSQQRSANAQPQPACHGVELIDLNARRQGQSCKGYIQNKEYRRCERAHL